MSAIRTSLSTIAVAVGAAAVAVLATSATSSVASPSAASASGVTVYHYQVPAMSTAASKVTFQLPKPADGLYLASFHVQALTRTRGANIVCELEYNNTVGLNSYGSDYPPDTTSSLYYSITDATGVIGIGPDSNVQLFCEVNQRGATMQTTGTVHNTVELEKVDNLQRETVPTPK